jgi:hypothetical protein
MYVLRKTAAKVRQLIHNSKYQIQKIKQSCKLSIRMALAHTQFSWLSALAAIAAL